MAALAWWSLPIGATLLAVLWTMIARRQRPPADTHETVEDYARFRAALAGSRQRQPSRTSRWRR